MKEVARALVQQTLAEGPQAAGLLKEAYLQLKETARGGASGSLKPRLGLQGVAPSGEAGLPDDDQGSSLGHNFVISTAGE